MSVRKPVPIYGYDRPLTAEDRAAQIRGLSIIGLASTSSSYNLCHYDIALVAVFEVIARLADEIEGELADMKPSGSAVAPETVAQPEALTPQ